MSNKTSMGNLDLKELKEKMQETKAAIEQAKVEYELNGGNREAEKQPLGQKIVGVLIIIALFFGLGWALVSNIGLMLLPKNSITIVVRDENGEHLEGVSIRLVNHEDNYYGTHDNVSNLTLLNMQDGEYTLTFEDVPEGYNPDKLIDTFTLPENGKVKVEYICREE